MRGDTQRAREQLGLCTCRVALCQHMPALGHIFASAWSRRLQLDPCSHCLTVLCHPDPKMSLFDRVLSEKGRRLLRTEHRQGSVLLGRRARLIPVLFAGPWFGTGTTQLPLASWRWLRLWRGKEGAAWSSRPTATMQKRLASGCHCPQGLISPDALRTVPVGCKQGPSKLPHNLQPLG